METQRTSTTTWQRQPGKSTQDAWASLNLFVSGFLNAPASVASPLPSSPRMAHALLDDLAWETIRVMVEFGPGTGAFTRLALSHLRRDAELIAIDNEPRFTRFLRDEIADPRLTAITGSVHDVTRILQSRGISEVDCILSGVPFSMFQPRQAQDLVEQAAQLLAPRGLFLAYQMRRSIENQLIAVFPWVERRYCWQNLPPCHLFKAGMAPTIGPEKVKR